MLNTFPFTMHSLPGSTICKNGTVKLTIHPSILSLTVCMYLVCYYTVTDPFLVLDPTRKLTYVEAAWEYERVESNMQRLRKIVSSFSIFLLI